MKWRNGAAARGIASCTLIWPSMYGLMPASYALLITGDITNSVRNSERPSITWFGGVLFVPSAWRRKPSTMMMRVNDVIISKMAGSAVSAVINASIWIDNDQV